MGVAIDFTGMCLFVERPQRDRRTFDVLLAKGHRHAAHTPYLTIDTDRYDVKRSTKPDHVIVVPGRQQFAIWNLSGRDVLVGDGGHVEGTDTIAQDEGPPLFKWESLHWMINFSEAHGRKFHVHPKSGEADPGEVPGLAARVRLAANGKLKTLKPRHIRKLLIKDSDGDTVVTRTFADTIRFETREEILRIGPFNGPFQSVYLDSDGEASITCQSPDGDLGHFAGYYHLVDPNHKLPEYTLEREKCSSLTGFRSTVCHPAPAHRLAPQALTASMTASAASIAACLDEAEDDVWAPAVEICTPCT